MADNKIATIAKYPYYNTYSINYANNSNTIISFDKNNIYNHSLITDLTGENIEIPAMCRASCENILIRRFRYDKLSSINTVVLPLFVSYINNCKKGSFSTILKGMFPRTPNQYGLIRAEDKNGNIYYGYPGLILNKFFEPLLMCSFKARKVEAENGNTFLKYYKAVCRINPKVFETPKDTVNKGIINKLIPIYASTKILLPSISMNNSAKDTNIEIIIDDFSNMFITPVVPRPSEDINESLNKCLNDNIEDVLSLIK